MANEVTITVKGRDQGAKKVIEDTGKSLTNVGNVARGILAAGLIQDIGQKATQFFGQAVRASNDLGESVNAVNRIFGAASKEILDWGETSANSYGLSSRAFNQMAVPLGAALKNQGLALGDVSDHTIRLTERAADMASVFNTDVTEALAAIQAGLRGEADPLERFGVGLSAAAVEARALADTGKQVASELTSQEKILARLNLLYDQTEDTAGDFAATSDGLANSQRIATARMEEAQAKIGGLLVPALATAYNTAANLLTAFVELPSSAQAVIGAVALLAGGLAVLAPRLMAAQAALMSFGLSARAANLSLGIIGVALAALSTALVIFGGRSSDAAAAAQEFRATLNETTGEITQNTRALALQRLEQVGAAAAAEQLGISMRDLTNAALGDAEASERVTRRLNELEEGAGSLGFVLDKDVSEALAKVRGGVDSTSEALQTSQEAHRRAAEAGLDNADAMGEVAGAHDEAAEAADAQATSLKELSEQLRAQADPVFALLRAQDQLAESQQAVTEAADEHGKNSPEYRRALREQAMAALEVVDAAGELAEDFNGKLTPAMRRVLREAGFTAGEIKVLERDFRNARRSADRLDGARVDINVRSNAGSALRTLQDVQNALSRLDGRSATVHVDTRGGPNVFMASGGITPAAGGGPRGRRVLVGEQGPEMVDLAPGSTVHTAGATQAMLNGGGGGHITVELVPSPRASTDLANAIIKMLDVEVRNQYGGDITRIGARR